MVITFNTFLKIKLKQIFSFQKKNFTEIRVNRLRFREVKFVQKAHKRCLLFVYNVSAKVFKVISFGLY